MKIIPDKLLKSNFQLSGTFDSIVFSDIIQLIQKKFTAFNDKYLIDTRQNLYKTKLFYAKYSVNALHKEVKKLIFPYFKEIRANIDKIIAEKNDTKDAIFQIPTNIIAFLEKKFNIRPLIMTNISGKDPILFLNNGEIDENGNYKTEKYGIFEYTHIETCKKCNGEKFITCINEECKGLHSWTCSVCNGKGVVACATCGATGYNICNTCHGKGDMLCLKCKGKDKNCKFCNNGVQTCISCNGKGEMICADCGGTAYNTCKICDGTGMLTCSSCFNLDEHYGKIVCPDCNGMGKVISLVFVEGQVKEYFQEVILSEKYDNQNIVTADKIYGHCNRLANTYENTRLIEPKLRATVLDDLLIRFRDEFNVKINEYPLILKEGLYYEEIPVVKFFARHILTNTVHEIAILDLFRNPEIIIETDPEKSKKIDIKDTLKSGVQFIMKLLKTKHHTIKEDLRKQLFLLIYAAKADGNIAEEEKYYLIDAIGSLSQFTNREKKEFYDMLNVESLRALQPKDVMFSTEDKFNEVFKQVENLINSDGEVHQLEQVFLDRLKQLQNDAENNMNKEKK